MAKAIGIKQPGCRHLWKVYMVRRTKRPEPELLKYRYYRCLKCGSTMKTVETPTEFKHKR